ncbi:hypothetical protein E2C01_047102 [Portunus trituberculatus]|uniref:Uncharacterized protein n=1 Tax=Portunus trituberculatus TaxID=210409 RepID=A0A5B7G7M8_PORTR|nr:hypothetical protein [Portunus trituberculatus]
MPFLACVFVTPQNTARFPGKQSQLRPLSAYQGFPYLPEGILLIALHASSPARSEGYERKGRSRSVLLGIGFLKIALLPMLGRIRTSDYVVLETEEIKKEEQFSKVEDVRFPWHNTFYYLLLGNYRW